MHEPAFNLYPVSPAGALRSPRRRQPLRVAGRSPDVPASDCSGRTGARHSIAFTGSDRSGGKRRDPVSGGFNPWPWTINVDGQGSFYDTKIQAVSAAVSMRPKATRSVDVGCMQISLTFHPDAFPGMDTAFDPGANAEYGARFLVQLFEKSGSWPKAVELYHSATPEIGQEYQRRVYAAWPEEQKFAEMIAPSMMGSALPAMGNRSQMWTPLRPGAARILPLATGLGGATVPGRSLDAYRLAPVRMAWRLR